MLLRERPHTPSNAAAPRAASRRRPTKPTWDMRFAAALVDAVLIIGGARLLDGGVLRALPPGTLTLWVGLAYCVGFWVGYHGQTPGKMLLGLRVVNWVGGKVGLTAALLRYFGYVVTVAATALVFITRRRARWADVVLAHELISRTRVVLARP